MNGALVLVFDVLEDSSTVSVVLVDFLSLAVLETTVSSGDRLGSRAECACWSQTAL